MATEIKLIHVNTTYSEIVKSIQYELILEDKYIQILEKCKCTAKDDDTGLEKEIKVNLDLIHLKYSFVGVSVLYDNKSELNYLQLDFIGSNNEWNIYFESRNRAMEVRDKILTWLLK